MVPLRCPASVFKYIMDPYKKMAADAADVVLAAEESQAMDDSNTVVFKMHFSAVHAKKAPLTAAISKKNAQIKFAPSESILSRHLRWIPHGD